MIRGEIDATVKRHVPPKRSRSSGTSRACRRRSRPNTSCRRPSPSGCKAEPDLEDDALRERIEKLASDAWHDKEAQVGAELMRQFERSLMLQTLDHHWREHLASLDHLRQGIHLRGYAQKNPKQEYKREAFELFSDMLDRIKQDVVRVVLTVQVRSQEDVQAVEPRALRSATCSTSTPTTTRRSAPMAMAATPRSPARRRSCAPARRSDATTRARAARARSTSTATGGSGKWGQSEYSRPEATQTLAHVPRIFALTPFMPVNYTPPTAESLLPVAGVALGTAAAKHQELGSRRRRAHRRGAGHRRRGRLHAEPLLRGAGASSAASTSPAQRQRALDFRALVVNAGNANAGTGDAGLADARGDVRQGRAARSTARREQVLPFSTGVIMEPLPVDRIVDGLPRARAAAAPRRLARRGARRS